MKVTLVKFEIMSQERLLSSLKNHNTLAIAMLLYFNLSPFMISLLNKFKQLKYMD